MSRTELVLLGLRRFGNNVQISRFARIYNPENITIGNNVRIDDFCTISAGTGRGIRIDDYVHIAAQVGMWGQGGIRLADFTAISAGSKIYSVTDDYSGEYLSNPTVPLQYRSPGVTGASPDHAPVTLEKHVLIGANTVILPQTHLGEGACVGAGSVVTRDCNPWTIYGGTPAKPIKPRRTDLLAYEHLIRDRESRE